MSDPSPQKPNSEQLDEELVAYLDGELESQASQKLENLLATDERARQRLNQLAVSWDMLDQLPRASVDDLFTRTTVEMVAVAAEDEITRTSSGLPARKRRHWLAGGVATLLAAAVGFMAIGIVMPDQNDPLLRNLPVVVNLDMYRSVGDVDLLKKLDASDLFTADAAELPRRTTSTAGGPAVRGAATTSTILVIVPKTISERRAWIAALSPDKKLELNHDLEKFVALSSDERQALRGIDDYLLANPEQADQLTHIMQRYHDWLKTLTPAERADLSDSPTPEQHLAEIKKLRQDQDGRMFVFARLGSGQGPSRAMDPVMRWVQDFAVQHEKEILEALPEERQQNLKKMAQRTSERGGEHGGERGGQSFYQRNLAWELWQPNSPVKMPDITEADVKPLMAQLTPERQTALQAATDSDERVQLLRQWIRDAIAVQRAQFGSQGIWRMGGGGNFERRPRIDDEQLKRYEDKLSPEEKKRFSSLTDEQKRTEIMEQLRKRRPQGAGRPGGMGSQRPRDDASHGPPAGKDAPEQNEHPPADRPDEDMDPAPPPPMP